MYVAVFRKSLFTINLIHIINQDICEQSSALKLNFWIQINRREGTKMPTTSAKVMSITIKSQNP